MKAYILLFVTCAILCFEPSHASVEQYKNVSNSIEYAHVINRNYIITQDMFLAKIDNDVCIIPPNEFVGSIPSSIENYRNFGDKWIDHEKQSASFKKEVTRAKPFPILGVIVKGTVVSLANVFQKPNELAGTQVEYQGVICNGQFGDRTCSLDWLFKNSVPDARYITFYLPDVPQKWK